MALLSRKPLGNAAILLLFHNQIFILTDVGRKGPFRRSVANDFIFIIGISGTRAPACDRAGRGQF
jgi:hypothetical protein